jgi:SAM-dependent methyltransferase
MVDENRAPGTHDWAGETGETWLAHADGFEDMLAPVGDAFLAHCAFAAGERVIDIGCGAGGTTRAIARRVGSSGSVTGADISAGLIAESARRAAADGLANAQFVVADAASDTIAGAPFDRLFSRFGSMFFADFPAAFANLHRLVRPGGRIDLAVWASMQENPWQAETRAVLARFVELPKPDPEAPGPMALADPERVRGLLSGAGFTAVEHAIWRGPQRVGGPGRTPDEAAEFLMDAMPLASVIRDEPPELRAQIREALTAMLARYATPTGVEVPGAAWFVTARA